MSVPHAVSPLGEGGIDQHSAALRDGVREAGNPYLDWFFGGSDTALAVLRDWITRRSSEVYGGRATVALAGGGLAGGFIALGGAELARCRQADTFAALRQAGTGGQAALAVRIRVASALFPPVAPDEFYLSKLWVSPGGQGRGLGRTLLHGFLATGVRAGFRRFRLDVCAANSRAITLYRSSGFETLRESCAPEAGMRYLRMGLLDGSHAVTARASDL